MVLSRFAPTITSSAAASGAKSNAAHWTLVATARWLAARYPTRRAQEQTFAIATRLHRGEALHEA